MFGNKKTQQSSSNGNSIWTW